jgi:hypothetical protein
MILHWLKSRSKASLRQLTPKKGSSDSPDKRYHHYMTSVTDYFTDKNKKTLKGTHIVRQWKPCSKNMQCTDMGCESLYNMFFFGQNRLADRCF